MTPRSLLFGYRIGRRHEVADQPGARDAGMPDDPIAARPHIPASSPWTADSVYEIEEPPAFRLVRTPIGIARLGRAAVLVVGLGALYGAVLALTSDVVDAPAASIASAPSRSVTEVLAAQPQPEAAAASAGERVGRELLGALRVEGAPKKL